MAYSILDDAAEADEAAQDAFVSALGALRSYRGDATFKTWLYAITVNVCRGRLRKRHAQERLQIVMQAIFQIARSETEHPESVVAAHESDEVVRQAVHALAEKLQLPIILRYEHELPIAEIAQILKVSDRTVHTRLRAAHDQLRCALSGQTER
ncbi:MAG TPA: sigma-70 family RNA polymerase sigma factor [Anaerolineae bacterium]|nr:sigma-70 family RNA polymerase sigma factor [Anaerolineae bacterium]